MGLFDKKKKGEDDYDSPVEQVSLNAPKPAQPATPARQAAPAPAAQPAAAPAQSHPLANAPAAAAAPAAPAPRAPAPPPEQDMDMNYGIDKAIELMRLLPADNIELVVQVVKKTLESIHIQVPSIIKDAARKQKDIEFRVDVLKREIADLESEIHTRKTEIGGLEADHRETTTVKERLELAEKLSAERAAAASRPKSSTVPPPMGAPAPSAPAPAAAAPSPAPGATTPGVPVAPQPGRSTGQYAAIPPKPADPAGSGPIKK